MKLPRVSCVLLSLLISTAVCCRNNGVGISRSSAQTLVSPSHAAVKVQEPLPPRKSEPDIQDKYRVIKMVRRGGWKVPGVDESVVSSERQEFKGAEMEASNIFVTILKLGDEASVEFAPFVPTEFRSRPRYSTIFIRKFDTKGQVFCYEVFASPVRGRSTSGKTLVSSEMSNFLYYDGDGDGVLETFEWGTTSTIEKGPPIPEWVSNLDRSRL